MKKHNRFYRDPKEGQDEEEVKAEAEAVEQGAQSEEGTSAGSGE